MLETLTILVDARQLLAHPKHWTQRTWARDDRGNPTSALDPYAKCWCAGGAIRKAAFSLGRIAGSTWDEQSRAGDEASFYLGKANGLDLVGSWNDDGTHEEVLAGFDKAIAKLRDAQN